MAASWIIAGTRPFSSYLMSSISTLTPCIPLSLEGEGEDITWRGRRPFKLLRPLLPPSGESERSPFRGAASLSEGCPLCDSLCLIPSSCFLRDTDAWTAPYRRRISLFLPGTASFSSVSSSRFSGTLSGCVGCSLQYRIQRRTLLVHPRMRIVLGCQ